MELLLRWLNEELNLSTQVVFLEEQSRNGYLFGEVFAAHNQQSDFHQFINDNTSAAKLRNYTLLEPTFRRLDVKFDAKTAFEMSEGAPKVALSLLAKVRSALCSNFPTKQRAEYTTILRVSRPQFDATMQKTFEDSLRVMLESDKEIRLREAVKRFTLHGEYLQHSATVSSQHSLHSAFQEIEFDIHRRRYERTLQDEARAEWEASQYMQWKMNQMRARKRRQMHATFVETQQMKTQTWKNTQRQTDAELVEQSLADFDDKLAKTVYQANTQQGAQSPTSIDQDGVITWDEATLKKSYRQDLKTMRHQKQERTEREATRERRRKRYLKTDEQHWADMLHANMVGNLWLAASRLSRAEECENDELNKLETHRRLFEANRKTRQQLYEHQTEADLGEDAQFREYVLSQDLAECNTCASMLQERQHIAEQAALASQGERRRLLCLDSLWDLVELALCTTDARRFVDENQESAHNSKNILPGYPTLWDDMKALYVSGSPMPKVSCWLFEANANEAESDVSCTLKVRDANNMLRSIASAKIGGATSNASFHMGEALIELRCLANPLRVVTSPTDRLPSFKHRLAICGSPGHDAAFIASNIAEKLNLFVIGIHDLIAECANLVIQGQEHLQSLPLPVNLISNLVSAVETLASQSMCDIATFSGSRESNPACIALQELCDNATSLATSISLDLKVAGATAIQSLQDGEDVSDDLVVKLAILGIRAAGLRFQYTQLEEARFNLRSVANEIMLSEWKDAMEAARKEIATTRTALESNPDLDDPEIALAIEELEAQLPRMPETQSLAEPGIAINGWIISDFPSTPSQARLFVEKVSGFHENQPPEWRGDRSSSVYPAGPAEPPTHACCDPGVDMFIKFEELNENFCRRVVSTRSSQQGATSSECSLSDIFPQSVQAEQLLCGALNCVAPTHSQFHMLSVQRQALNNSTELFEFLGSLNCLRIVSYNSLAVEELIRDLQRSKQPQDIEPSLLEKHAPSTLDLGDINGDAVNDNDAEVPAEAELQEAPPLPVEFQATAKPSVEKIPQSQCVVDVANISAKAAVAVVERVAIFERTYVGTTQAFTYMLRHVTVNLYQRENSTKKMLRAFIHRRANYQEIWDGLCSSINGVDDDFRFDGQVVEELALRCELARRTMWQTAEKRTEENHELLKSISEDSWREDMINKLDTMTSFMIQAEVGRFEVGCGLASDFYRLNRKVKSTATSRKDAEASNEYEILMARHWEQPLAPQNDSAAATTSKKSAKAAGAVGKDYEPPLPRIEHLSTVVGADSIVADDKSKKGKDSKSTKKAATSEAEPIAPLLQVDACMKNAMHVMAPWREGEFKLPEAATELADEDLVSTYQAIWFEAERCNSRIESFKQSAMAMHDHLTSRIENYNMQLRAEIWAQHLAEASAFEACLKSAEQCVLENRPLSLDIKLDAAQATVLPSRLLQPPPPAAVVAYGGNFEDHIAVLPTKAVGCIVRALPAWPHLAMGDVEEIASTLHRINTTHDSLAHIPLETWQSLVETAVQGKRFEVIS